MPRMRVGIETRDSIDVIDICGRQLGDVPQAIRQAPRSVWSLDDSV
jgi:hypothetical protein